MNIFLWCLLTIGGFLLGSVYFSRIIVKAVSGRDLYEISDDGNPGTVNAFKACGAGWGMLCLFLDVLKGFLPVLLAAQLLDPRSWAMIFVTAAPVLGHAVGIFNGFRGGKCIAVSFGVLAGLLPVSYSLFLLAVPYILFSTLIKINPNGLRSIVVYAVFALSSVILAAVQRQPYIALSCMIIAFIVIIKHGMKLKSEMKKERDGEIDGDEKT